MEVIFKCGIPLSYDSTIHKICLSQKKTQLYLDNNLCALQSDMFRPRICHSLGQVSSKKHTLRITK